MAHDRHRTRDSRAHHGRPVSLLIPGKQISGEAEPQSRQEQEHANHPEDLPRPLVGSPEERLQHVDDHRHQHEARPPVVQPPHQPAQRQLPGDEGGRLIGRVRRRHVVDHQQHAGAQLHDKAEHRHTAEGVRPAHPLRQGLLHELPDEGDQLGLLVYPAQSPPHHR